MDRAVFPFGDGGKIVFVEDDLFQFVRADQRSGFRPHIVEIKGVFLAESQGSFGGVAAAGLVPAFAPFDDGVNVLAAGIGYELRKQVSDVRGIDTKLLQASLKKIGAYLPNCEV